MRPHLALLALLTLSACTSIMHATRPGAGGAPRDPTLVEVRMTGYEAPYEVVSQSVWEVAPTEILPAEIPEDVLAEMRTEAAQRGAEMLLLERFDSDWRKAWLGHGAIRRDTGELGIPSCTHASFGRDLEHARERAITSIQRLLYERPGVRGEVEVVFALDAMGRALGAAATPGSSRDGELQRCVLDAVYDTDFGAPVGFGCQGRLSVRVSSPTEVQ